MVTKRNRWRAALAAGAMLAGIAGACGARTPHTVQKPTAPLFAGLGSHHHPITTGEPLAQRYFDQGLIFAWGFNHAEAARSFRAAQRIDPDCAMCYWGEALVLGPNINAPMKPEDVPIAWNALRKAKSLASRASARERAYIAALEKRYAPEPLADRGPLDQAYAKAMGEVARRYPDDLDATTLYAEALMDTHPWDYWTRDGQARPWTPAIVSTLESVLARAPDHPGANHLYIHAVEASPNPERAMASADKLPRLVPGIGHVVHMPSHIYIRTGRYHEAALTNERAIAVDRAYLAQVDASGIYPQGYVPHNYHFLAAAATLEGRGRLAIETARQLASLVDRDQMRRPDQGTLQHYFVTPLYYLTRFGMWNEILTEPMPPEDLLYPRGVWHYARGMALAAKGRLREAGAELARLQIITRDPAIAEIEVWDVNRVADLLAIAAQVLAGKIAAAAGDFDTAIGHLREGVRMEDVLLYEEPPSWQHPVRQILGAVLIQAGQPAAAEEVFQEDLLRYPENGWSLFGLARSLEIQNEERAAQVAARRFAVAWARADIEPTLSIL